MRLSKMLRMMLSALCCAVMLWLAGCSRPSAADPLAFCRSAACAEVEWEKCGVRFRAIVKLGEMPEDGTARDSSVEFLLPAELSGIVVSRSAGEISLNYSDITLPGEVFDGMLAAADAFSQPGEIISVRTEGSKPRAETTVLILSGGYELTLDSKTGLPLRILTDGGEAFDILWYKENEQ